MINSAEQYEYVTGADVDEAHPHGDLDRIVIDGEVMPLRTGDTGNVDKDGNAIPRQKILRGEDIAFMLEAVAQRRHEYWWSEFVSWFWNSTGNKTYVTEANSVYSVSFSRKLSARLVRNLWDALDDVCDFALFSIDGISEAVTDYGKTFEEVYGRAGLPEGLRFHLTHPVPSYGAALPTSDSILSLFMTEAYLNCAVLGPGPRFVTGLSSIDLGFEIEGDDVFAWNDGSHSLVWGAHAKTRREDNGEGGTDLRSGTIYCYPKSDTEFFRVRAPHLAELKAVFCIRVYKPVYGGYDQKLVWLPIVAAKSGEWFSLTAGACGFSSKAGVVSLCEKSGLGVPAAPDPGDSYSADDLVKIEIVGNPKLLGRWDDHTKWR